jgi:hypothetical protein
VLLAAGVWLLLNVGSLALVLRIALALPEDYFESDAPSARDGRSGALAATWQA